MKSILRMTLFVVAAGCLFGVAMAGFDQSTVRLESSDGRYRSIRVDTDGYVRLVRRLSDTPCREGRNWGYDRNRIWVDNGCRAVFEYGRDARWDYDRRDDRWNDGRWDDNRRDDRWDNDRWGGGWRGNIVRIRLESERCRKDAQFINNREARIVRRLSDAPCREGYSWGRTSNVVWVDHGCRADFEVWTR